MLRIGVVQLVMLLLVVIMLCDSKRVLASQRIAHMKQLAKLKREVQQQERQQTLLTSKSQVAKLHALATQMEGQQQKESAVNSRTDASASAPGIASTALGGGGATSIVSGSPTVVTKQGYKTVAIVSPYELAITRQSVTYTPPTQSAPHHTDLYDPITRSVESFQTETPVKAAVGGGRVVVSAIGDIMVHTPVNHDATLYAAGAAGLQPVHNTVAGELPDNSVDLTSAQDADETVFGDHAYMAGFVEPDAHAAQGTNSPATDGDLAPRQDLLDDPNYSEPEYAAAKQTDTFAANMAARLVAAAVKSSAPAFTKIEVRD